MLSNLRHFSYELKELLLEFSKTYLATETKINKELRPGALASHNINKLQLNEEIEEDIKTFYFNIFEGFIPSTQQNASYFPFISIFITEGEDDLQNKNVTIQLDIGLYSNRNSKDNPTSYIELLEVLDSLFTFLSNKGHFACSLYTLKKELSWTLADDNTQDYAHAVVFLKAYALSGLNANNYESRTIEKLLEFDDITSGDNRK